ncbi:MAG: glycosyltransferase family 4 protein, partial [Myxococcales bacterium]
VVGDPERIKKHLPGTRVLPARTTSISAREQLELPLVLYRHRVDLFHATLFVAPALYHRPYVLTLHDVNYLALPQLYGRHREVYFRTAVRLFATRARAVLTVSEFSRREIEQRLHVPAERIDVVYNGVDARFSPAPAAQVEALRERRGLPAEYLLYVGSFVPHKNVPLLLAAYARLSGAPPLVLCGRHPETVKPHVERLGLARRVVLLDGAGDDELPALYSGATAFVFPSRYEGFGLPPLEAMACGTPTLVSNAGSLPEVTGGAARLFDPDDDVTLARQLEQVLGSPSLRAELALAGRVRAAQFSWQNAVARHAALYRRAA